jgi:hypothetical protein
MASKGKKTKHVIQTIGSSRSPNYPEPAMVPDGFPGRPIKHHEIELKHLYEQEIDEGSWTVKQMYDYLVYLEDFCGMPENEPSIYIPEESKYIPQKKILSNLRAQNFGTVENIELVPKCDQGRETVYNKVFVHFTKWNTYYIDPTGTTHVCLSTIKQLIDDFITKNENAIRTRFALITGKKLKLYYDKNDKSSFVEIMALRPEHIGDATH